ncbi:MAG TPA: TetR/AcrR family transcriptional regulator [Polyangiaceae bacterium]|nr:TetR/AcrR family transcriptional regulator [Polyangiaceae bacterium]
MTTVDAILKATAHILVKEGYDRASTNKIAATAGVSIGSLYQYFPSKEALVAAIADRHLNEMMTLLQSEIPTLVTMPLEAAIERVVRLMVATHSVDPKLHKVLVEQVPRVGKMDRVEGLEREMVGLARTYLESRRDELDVEDLDLAAYIVVGMIESLTHAAVLTRPDLLGEPFIREVSLAVVRYLVGSRKAGGAGQRRR